MKRIFFFMMALLCCFFSAMPMHISSLWKKCLGKEGCRQVRHDHFSKYSGKDVQLKLKLSKHQIFFIDKGGD